MGNKNRQLGEEPLDATLVVRVTSREKGEWTRAARPGKLADWVRSTLNQVAERLQSGRQSGGRNT